MVLHVLTDEQNAEVKEQKMDVRSKALKTLINFSQDEPFVMKMCELNIVRKIYDLLKENVQQNLKNAELDDGVTNKAKLDSSTGTFEVSKPEPELVVNKKTGKLEDKKEDFQESTIESCFMLLSNITAIEHGQVHVLGLQTDQNDSNTQK